MGGVSQLLTGKGEVGAHTGNAAIVAGGVDDLGIAVGEFQDGVYDLPDAGFDAAADIDDHAVDSGGCGGGDHGAYHIVEVDEIALLVAVTVNDERAAAYGLAQETGDDGWVRWRQVLAGAEGIENAQSDGFDAPKAADRAHVIFRGELGDGVWGGGLGRSVLFDGLLGLVAIDGSGGDEYDATDADIAHSFH